MNVMTAYTTVVKCSIVRIPMDLSIAFAKLLQNTMGSYTAMNYSRDLKKRLLLVNFLQSLDSFLGTVSGYKRTSFVVQKLLRRLTTSIE